MPWADINGIRMYYETHGEGEAIVFAHGAGGDHLSWWQQVPFFRSRYRCVTFDHRGFGRTADVENGPGANAYPEDLRALMDHLGIERAYLVAQSMGGGTCMGFTVAYPERVKALVMADTTGAMSDETLTQMRQQFQESQGQPQGLAGRAYAPELRVERPHMAFLYDSIMALNPPRPQPAGERDARYVATTEKLAALRVPVQFVVGEKDAIVSPQIIRHAASLIPGARFAEVAGAGHSVYFEKADAFNEIVASFFEAVERASAK
ncbi:MAG TPA: alpha/beta hydrolase [Dehalococcoidia bacterium]|nr:alpha/beta hydrolase [Dehalococcoidia bacterium]